MNASSLALPELQDALLDLSVVEQLFRDIAACAEVLEVLPKFADRSYVTAKVTLAEAHDLLLSHQARAIQIRYRYDGKEWWDTLMNLNGQFRLVRMEQNFGPPDH